MLTAAELEGGFTLGDWEVLPGRRLLRRGDEEISPQRKVYDVLLAIAARNGDVVSTDQLIDEVWDGRAQSDEPVLRCISVLRGHLGDKKPFRYIDTVHGVGYRLVSPVTLHAGTVDEADEAVAPSRDAQSWWKTLGVAAAVVFVALAGWNWIQGDEPTIRSLAILPIANLSGDPANQYIADGIKDTLARRLAELQGFTIKNTELDYEGRAPGKIAAELGVESLLTGSVELQNGVLRVGYEIVRGSDGVTMLAGDESGKFDDLWALQERLANAVRDELAGPRTPELITKVEPDSAAYNSYLRGMYKLEHRFERTNLEESIELFKESVRLDENYGPAYLGLASAYALLPDYRGEDWEVHLQLAVHTVEQGIANDPSIEDPGGAIYGFVYYQQKDWKNAEANYLRAVNAPIVDSNSFSWYSQMLASVGRLEDALDMALAAEVIDPDSTVVNSRIAMVYTWLDNREKAHEYFARANDFDATGRIHVMAHSLLLLRDGEAEKSRELTYEAARLERASTDWIDPVYQALLNQADASEALAAIDRAWQQGLVIPHIVILARTMLGDLDGAMEIASLLVEKGEFFSMEILYSPELAPLREHPSFMPLLERLGVADYWKDTGCRWVNDRVEC